MAAIKKKSEPSKPPVEIVPVGLLEAVLAVLAYGRSGTGKTTFASTFPKPLLLLDVKEKGTDSVSNVSGVDVARIETWDDFVNLYWWVEKGDTKYKSIVVDQVTQLQDLAIIKTMEDDGKKPGDQISKRNWGQAAGLMKTWLLNYRDLIDHGIHIVFLAHDRVTKEDDDGGGDDQIEPVVGARIMPSVAAYLNGAVKVIGNTFIREKFSLVKTLGGQTRKTRSVQYSMRIGPHANYTTKTRSPVGMIAPATVVDPTYDKLMDVMTGKYKDPDEKPVREKIQLRKK